MPGVYADVAKATCFIDWASKCVDGSNVDHFGFSSSCTEDWAKLTYCDYRARIQDLENEVIPCNFKNVIIFINCLLICTNNYYLASVLYQNSPL